MNQVMSFQMNVSHETLDETWSETWMVLSLDDVPETFVYSIVVYCDVNGVNIQGVIEEMK